MTTSDNAEARVLVQRSIDAKESELNQAEKDRAAAHRKHQRLGDKMKGLRAELDGLRHALNELGGPVEEEAV
jgi:phage shock protein A